MQPIRKWAGRLAEIGGSLSKHHAVVFWLRKQGEAWGQEVLQKPDAQFERDDFTTASGMFSKNGPDTGFVVMAEHFDQRIRGRVADFGAGWGYLSHRLVQQSPRIEQLDLFDADWASLQAVKTNVGEAEVSVIPTTLFSGSIVVFKPVLMWFIMSRENCHGFWGFTS